MQFQVISPSKYISQSTKYKSLPKQTLKKKYVYYLVILGRITGKNWSILNCIHVPAGVITIVGVHITPSKLRAVTITSSVIPNLM